MWARRVRRSEFRRWAVDIDNHDDEYPGVSRASCSRALKAPLSWALTTRRVAVAWSADSATSAIGPPRRPTLQSGLQICEQGGNTDWGPQSCVEMLQQALAVAKEEIGGVRRI